MRLTGLQKGSLLIGKVNLYKDIIWSINGLTDVDIDGSEVRRSLYETKGKTEILVYDVVKGSTRTETFEIKDYD